MPASHVWEIALEGQTIEASKQEIMKLAKAARESGREFTVFENGEPMNSKSKKQVDTFKSEMFLDLTSASYQVSSLVRELETVEEEELATELDDLCSKFRVLYEKVCKRIGIDQDTALYGPELPVEA